jgi:NAD+ kinase
MSRTIAVFGGSFNPPGSHHRALAERLAVEFDEVVVVPCGPRPDKPITNDVPPTYRAAMVDLTFRAMPKVRVDLFDLEASTFTRTFELEARYQSEGEPWHVIGTDLLRGGSSCRSVVHAEWARGAAIWRELRFAVMERAGFAFEPSELPPQHRLVPGAIDGASSLIRERLFHRESIAGLVSAEVAELIDRHGLYRGMPPTRRARLALGAVRPLVVASPDDAEACRVAERWAPSDPERANLVVAIGGDGTMLHAIRRLPFYGINTGHVGFLLNHAPPDDYLGESLVVEQLPLLWVEIERADGERHAALAFNDAWVERASGQTAWLRVTVDGRERLAPLVADGALIATAAGSTCYARAMGAAPLPLDTAALVLVGSNVLRPAFFQPAVLPLESVVELRTLDPVKRPLRGYIDGVEQGEVRSMTARVSNIAAVELAFDPRFDAAEKLARLQFPPAAEPSRPQRK